MSEIGKSCARRWVGFVFLVVTIVGICASICWSVLNERMNKFTGLRDEISEARVVQIRTIGYAPQLADQEWKAVRLQASRDEVRTAMELRPGLLRGRPWPTNGKKPGCKYMIQVRLQGEELDHSFDILNENGIRSWRGGTEYVASLRDDTLKTILVSSVELAETGNSATQ